jgi:hypothetical protein
VFETETASAWRGGAARAGKLRETNESLNIAVQSSSSRAADFLLRGSGARLPPAPSRLEQGGGDGVEGCGDFRSRLRGCHSQDSRRDSEDNARAWGGGITVTGSLQGGACEDDGGDGAADDDCRFL